MKTFDMLRRGHNATIAELNFLDIVKLLVGREIELWAYDDLVVLRNGRTYDAFNLEAPAAIEAAGPASKSRDCA